MAIDIVHLDVQSGPKKSVKFKKEILSRRNFFVYLYFHIFKEIVYVLSYTQHHAIDKKNN